jgi:hypothetical protein
MRGKMGIKKYGAKLGYDSVLFYFTMLAVCFILFFDG